MPRLPGPVRGHQTAPPLLRHQIEDAQRHTKSNSAAARWLGVTYARYKKYADLYGLFAGHLNLTGKGIDKGFSKRPTSIPLRDILAGKHPTYSVSKLKNRLLARGKLHPHCALCGFNEQRVTDQKAPLMLHFKDGDRTHMALENLELRCYNCMFLTTGAPNVMYRQSMEKSLRGESIGNRRAYGREETIADGYERDPVLMEEDVPHGVLSAAERQALLDEINET